MRLGHLCRALALVLCVIAGPLTPVATAADDPDVPRTSLAVARLYLDAARATTAYEQGRRAAEVQRAKAEWLDRLLADRRRDLVRLHDDMGRVARARYRTGGNIAYTAQLLLADDPEELMRGQRLAWQADMAVTRLYGKARRAEGRLTTAQRRAQAAWRDLADRRDQLEGIRKSIAARLEEARWELQGEADRSVAAGQCRGAVRLEEPPGSRPASAWTAPVETYRLSAGFDSAGESAGERWAQRHTGQDFAVDIGTPVRAVGAGRVVSVSCGGGFGIEVVVGHPGGYYSQYAHLAAVTVDQGDRVGTGQWIGQAGTTGNSTGPHLHFEIRLTPEMGSAVDPVRWLGERGVTLRSNAAEPEPDGS
ncbi:M23 family metallopeptidase [Streptomyces melanogenes]|uniref:M23 family metallopeptidase n=1 Tax=Streptomyces melanogenes TaxID=67326 RepID=UPI00167DCDCF|nr:M23 family metallopeptidase [Streptomyces melanogenes]